ncbi:hypothetical protein [uncultured Kordia sp.]|uniref:hypothetical protein n=1 Tax=uncultured Kordia sp. TaxID=507699 RepID=UPI002616F60D|nr:hypothetical protein [uncultured Kordia sp.]
MSTNPTTKFISTLEQTPTIAGDLNANLKRLKNNLDDIIKVLGYSKTIDDNLTKLDEYLTEANQLLTFVSVIPQIRPAATTMKQAISVLQPQVKSAKKAADSIESVVKPLREALQKLDPVLQKLIDVTQEIQDTSQKFYDTFTAVYKCVESLPDGSAKEKSIDYLNSFSKDAEPIVSALNTAMSEANSAINSFYNELEKIKEALNPLNAINDAINDILSALDPIMNLLKELENKLKDITIPVLIPYPHEVSLYDIFKFFESVAELIDKAFSFVQDLVNDLISKILNINLEIPGLSDIFNIHINVPSIPDFSKYLKELEDAIKQITDLFDKFSLKCPPDSKG